MSLRSALPTTLIVGALMASGYGVTAAQADTVASQDLATSWLLRQAPQGWLTTDGTNPDWGLTSDALLGLVASGASSAEVKALADSVETAAGVRYGIYHTGTSTSADAGALGKLLLVSAVTGRPATSYGGMDVRSQVLATMQSSGQFAGSQAANVIGQSYAILGLARTGSLPTQPVSWLLKQQCTGGYFRLYQSATQCGTASIDRDATAMAIMALRGAVAKGQTSAKPALDKAVAWLVSDQRADGSWVGSSFTPEANSNTTGLAAAALSGLNATATQKATAFVTSMQLGSGSDAGAIAYSSATLAAANGVVPASTRSQWVRATAQAIAAFRPVDYFSMQPVAKAAQVGDVYATVGWHTVNGRKWTTTCEPYSSTQRCRTNIWGSVVQYANGTYRRTWGWQFNNLTYLPLPRSAWASNHLGQAGYWSSSGRQWRTDCDTALTGNGCRSYIYGSYVVQNATTKQFSVAKGYMFNNMVRFSD